jgi:hypothetical protein
MTLCQEIFRCRLKLLGALYKVEKWTKDGQRVERMLRRQLARLRPRDFPGRLPAPAAWWLLGTFDALAPPS